MTTTLQQLTASQANKEVAVNRNFETLSPSGMYGKKQSTTTGLTLGYYGGHIASSVIADGTVALTNAATNYVVAHRTTGAVTAATNTTNWDATSTYGRLFKATTAGSVITALEFWHQQSGGWFDRAAAGGATAAVVSITDTGGYFTGTEVETALQEIGAALQSAGKVPAQRYTIELANTTDSDPGAGLIKFNNATPASATELYIDDSTSDSVDLSTLFASFGAAGFIKIQSVVDAGEWAIFKWTATPTDQTGYFKFVVTPQASKGTLDDADAVLIEFDSGVAPRETVSALATSGSVAIDYALGDYFTLALAGNVTTFTFSNLPGSGKGTSLMVRITQDSTPRTVGWPASFKWAGGVAGVVSTASGAVDVLAITTFDNGTTWQATLAKAWS
jgi:hypothetical protein